MRIRLILATALLTALPAAFAQPVGAPTPAASPAKKELIQKILTAQQGGVEVLARQLVEAPAARLLQQAGPALQQRVAADKREAVAKEIQADVKKYVEESAPIVRERALKLMPVTIGPLLEEKFSEDELKQIVAVLESPAYRKFNQLGNEMQRALGEKLVAETRTTIEPKMQALQQSVAKRLGVAPAASAASAPKKN